MVPFAADKGSDKHGCLAAQLCIVILTQYYCTSVEQAADDCRGGYGVLWHSFW